MQEDSEMKPTDNRDKSFNSQSSHNRGSAILAAFLASLLALACGTARGNVLVYEGFHPADYNNVGDNTQMTPSNASTTGDYTVGLATGAWSMTGSMPKVYGANYGLALPSAMTAAGFSALGGSIGLNPGDDSTALRSASHGLVAETLKVSSGSLYVRALLNLDSKAATKLVAGEALAQKDGGYFGFGLTTGDQDYYLLTASKSSIAFVVWKNSSNQYVLSLAHTTAAGTAFTSYPLVTGISLGTTYLCYAEINVGAGTDGKEVLRAGAMAVDAFTTDTPWAKLSGNSESIEVELMTDSSYPTRIAVAGPYGTKKDNSNGYFRADELVVGTELSDILLVNTTKPILSDGALALANGVYTASAALAQSDANVTYTLSDGDDATTETPFALGVGSFTADTVASGTFAAPVDDTTYEVVLTAENAGGETDTLALGTIYGGTLSLAKVSDAAELGVAPATLTVSRENADPLPLVVNYAFADGTAVAGVNYVDDAGAVTIPAGETSATIAVRPILDASTAVDTTMMVSIAAGNYAAPAAVVVTIANFTTPEGCNYWMGGTATDGKFLASTAANWTQGHAPLATENVFFDGLYSTEDCEWDAAATATVASWTMQNGYTGIVTLDTVYPGKGDFTCLIVTGAMTVDSGTITHPQSRTQWQNAEDCLQDLLDNETYRVRIDAGSLVIGANGRIDARNKGYYHANSGNHTSPLPSHGGRLSASGQAPYDDVKEPIHIGMPYKRDGGTYYIGIGGGAIYLTSTGAIVVDGYIGADTGSDTWNRGYTLRCGAAAGSVYVRGATVSGSGTISASALKTSEQNYRGVGGRVAVIATSATPIDYSTLQLKATVYPFNNNNGQSSTYGSCGTVFIKDASQTYGTLLLDNADGAFAPSIARNTPVTTDGDWTFDAVGLGNYAILAVPVGTALHLPGGLDSVFSLNASGSTAYGSIRYEGGTLDLGSSTDQTMAGSWMLTGWTNLVLDADVTVKDGAAIGVPAMAVVYDTSTTGVLPDFVSCDVTVNGDLTVESTGSVLAKSCGMRKSRSDQHNGVLGFHSHGGRSLRWGRAADLFYEAYDSVFSPGLPGCTVPYPDGQTAGAAGGAVRLTVSGTLTLDGPANASGLPEAYNQGGNASGGAGGSLDFTVGRLAGSGSITADGGSYAWQRGPGGRIAVKLTGAGAGFANFVGDIRASGRARDGSSADTSAGTVYLQTAADGEKGGTVYIAMSEGNRNASNTNTTEMVSLGYGGDDVKDYKKVKYVVRDFGRAAVNADMKAASIEIADTNSSLDLEGHTLTVKSAKVGGVRLAPGTYKAGSTVAIGEGTLGDYLVDTADGAGGALVVSGGGFRLSLR